MERWRHYNRIENIHLVEYVKTAEGKKIVLNRVVKDEDWFDTIDAIMIEYNAVYVCVNHHSVVESGKALTNDGKWVAVRTKEKTSMKVSKIADFGNGRAKRVYFSTKALAEKMLKAFRTDEPECFMTDETTIEIPYRWGFLSPFTISIMYQNVRVFF